MWLQSKKKCFERGIQIMMLYPPMGDLMDKVGSRYMLVNAVARRAREIADEAEQQNMIIDEKTVSLAIDEIYTGKLIVNK
jgi:DNA-directed RNA polymerase subunit omega